MKLVNPSFEIYEQGPGLDGIYEAIERAGRTCYKSEAKYQYKDIETGEIIEGIPDDFGEYVEVIPPVSIQREGNIGKAVIHGKKRIFRRASITAKGFVDRMVASQHYAMLEHGTVYLKAPSAIIEQGRDELGDWSNNRVGPLEKYKYNQYSRVKTKDGITYVTTNMRVLVEHNNSIIGNYLDDLQYLCEPTEYHEKRVTVRFTTDRGVSHEFVRHRVFSFAQESTRYCNYSKDKFGNELTFIIPSWIDMKESNITIDSFECPVKPDEETYDFLSGLGSSERAYFRLLKKGWTPQQARQILPNALKTELVMTGFVSDWSHFFRLRTSILAETGKPHPDASALADPLYKEFVERGYMESLV